MNLVDTQKMASNAKDRCCALQSAAFGFYGLHLSTAQRSDNLSL